jgi:hypothetical protein
VPVTGTNLFGQAEWERRGENEARIRSLETSRLADEATLALKNLRVLDTSGAEDPATTHYLLQAGSTVAGTDASGDIVITYPTAFTTSTLYVVACEGDITHAAALVMPHVYSAASFTVRICNSTTGAAWATSGNMRINWIAVGT